MGQCLGLSASLLEKGPGILFRVINEGQIYPGFVIRVNRQIRAYLNVCAHVGLRLNGDKNTLFSRDGKYLYCLSHGATFEPESGLCIQGPCKGLSLIHLKIIEVDGKLILDDKVYKYYE